MRVLLADDHDDFLSVAARLLEPLYDVVAMVSDGHAAIAEAKRLLPDVLVLDVSMPVLNGIEAARELRAAGAQAKIIFLTVHEDPEFVRSAYQAGAQGYVVKSRLVSDLPLALNEVLAGRTYVSPFNSSSQVL